MARYSQEDKAKSYFKILNSAAHLFKRGGFVNTGIDSIMDKAGLTAGTFYAHFKSKADLLRCALAQTSREARSTLMTGIEGVPQNTWLYVIVKRYLSPSHRDQVSEGCPMPTLISELPRSDAKVRKVFDEYVNSVIKEWSSNIPDTKNLSPDERTLATLSLLIGGLAISRAVYDEDLSNKVLKSCQKLAMEGVEPPVPRKK